MSIPLEKLREIFVGGNYVNAQNFDTVAGVASKKGESIEIALV